jgi:hypothetical protein
MTDKEMALEIAQAFRRLQATETAYRTLLSRFRIGGEPVPEGWIARDVGEDLDPRNPFGQALHSFELQLESTSPSEVLRTLHRELFEPHE